MWLSDWSEVQFIFKWLSWFHCHPVISCFIKIKIGLTFMVPDYPGCSVKEDAKQVFLNHKTYNISIAGLHHIQPNYLENAKHDILSTRNVGQCPTWWLPCRIYVAPSVQRHKFWLTPTSEVPCSNAAKMRNLSKFIGVPQTHQQISAASEPKFTILWGHVGKTLLFNKFFPTVDTCLSCEGQMANFWRFFGPAFPASHAQHISDLTSKFALGPHHV